MIRKYIIIMLSLVGYAAQLLADTALVRSQNDEGSYTISGVNVITGEIQFITPKLFNIEVFVNHQSDRFVISGTKNFFPPRSLQVFDSNRASSIGAISINTAFILQFPSADASGALSDDGNMLIAASTDGFIEGLTDSNNNAGVHTYLDVIDLSARKVISRIPFNEEMQQKVLYEIFDKKIWIYSNATDLLRIYDFDSDEVVFEIKIDGYLLSENLEPESAESLKFYSMNNGKVIAFSEYGDYFELLIDESGILNSSIKHQKLWDGFRDFKFVSVSNSSEFIVVALSSLMDDDAQSSNTLMILNTLKPGNIKRVQLETGLYNAAIDSKGRYIVGSSDNSTVVLLNAKNGEVIKQHKLPGNEIFISGLVEDGSFDFSLISNLTPSEDSKEDIAVDKPGTYKHFYILVVVVVLVIVCIYFFRKRNSS